MIRARRTALALVVVAVGALSGFLLARLLDRHEQRAAIARHEVATRPIAAPAASQPQPDAGRAPGQHPIPSELPQITLPDPSGIKHSLSEWRGHPLLINFWATWCEPCRREIPLLMSLRHAHAAEGVEVIGIAVDFRDAVQQYARDMHIDYPLLVGEQDGLDAIAAFGMDAVFPFTVFADQQGRIVTLKIGELHAEESHLILDRIQAVDAGRIDLAAARAQIEQGMQALAILRARAQDAQSSGPHQLH